MSLGQLELKILWTKTFLGLSLNQISQNKILPLTNYFFWPKTDAWEQLQIELTLKPWLKNSEKVEILNLAAEVMNFWRNNRNKDNFEQDLKKSFPTVRIVKSTL